MRKLQYFHILPFFSGTIGTYTLDITAVRTSTAEIEDIEKNESIQIFPNPVSNIFEILYEQGFDVGASCLIIDLNGKVIKQFELTGQSKQIDISDLSKGIYTIKILNNDKTCFKKLCKI